jgi:hypothetical protein
MDSRVLLGLVDRHQLVTLVDATRAGVSRYAWHRAHRTGLLEAVHPGVSRLAVGAPSAWQPVAAAVRSGGPHALASHRTAAALWGAAVPGLDPIDVTVSEPGRRPRTSGVRLHRPRDLDDLRPVVRQGIPTTNPLRTTLDIGAVTAPEATGGVLEHFLVMKAFGLRTLRNAMERHSRQGRHGIGTLRLLLEEWALGDKPTARSSRRWSAW